MTKQPEALRLADYLESCDLPEAATELRRLHTLNQELLEALKLAMPDLHGYWRIKAEEAIAKAEGEKQ